MGQALSRQLKTLSLLLPRSLMATQPRRPGGPAHASPWQKEQLRWALGFSGVSWGVEQGWSRTQVWGQQGWLLGPGDLHTPGVIGEQLWLGRGHPGRLHTCH